VILGVSTADQRSGASSLPRGHQQAATGPACGGWSAAAVHATECPHL